MTGPVVGVGRFGALGDLGAHDIGDIGLGEFFAGDFGNARPHRARLHRPGPALTGLDRFCVIDGGQGRPQHTDGAVIAGPHRRGQRGARTLARRQGADRSGGHGGHRARGTAGRATQ